VSAKFAGISVSAVDFECSLRGPLKNLKCEGQLRLASIEGKNFYVKDCLVVFSLRLRNIFKDLRLEGELDCDTGTVFLKNSAIALGPSKILFSGETLSPLLDLNGAAAIGDTKINIAVSGSAGKPVLRVTSDPFVPEGELFVMLLTGKTWKGTESALTRGVLSPDLIKDFLDYFLFGGRASKLLQQFGIADVSLKYDKQAVGIGVTKDITGSVAVTYGVEQPQPQAAQGEALLQKVGAVYKFTEHLSVEGEKEFKPQERIGDQTPVSPTNDTLYIRYKGVF
jgi:hypothetical protein